MSGRSGLRVAVLVSLALLAGPGCGEGASPQLDRLAAEHRSDRGDVPGAAVRAGEDVPVRAEEVVYGEIDGTPLRGYLARAPEGDRGGPAILVIHEWWGLNDNIRTVTRQLAAEGYTALAVDLYEGRSSADPAQARRLAGEAMGRTPRIETNLRLARAHLGEAKRVGVIGWCFGGGWSLQTALLLPDAIDATVMYYGRVVTDPEQLARLRAPLLGVFAGRDRGIPVAQVREFERVLEQLGKPATILVFEDADHAFANPSGNRYQPEAAEQAWAETVVFFASELQAF
jgi:carboxymethylenebutenolidase